MEKRRGRPNDKGSSSRQSGKSQAENFQNRKIPAKNLPHFYVDNSDDLRNQDTFGDLSLTTDADFDFSTATWEFEDTMHRAQQSKSQPISINSKSQLTLEELESQMHQQFSVSPKRTIISVTELESSLFTKKESMNYCFLPPGLNVPVAKIKGKEVVVTFPKTPYEDFEDQINKYSKIMTFGDCEYITRIHTGQLTSERPELEDFYYKTFSKRSLRRRDQGNTPLYFPLPKYVNHGIAYFYFLCIFSIRRKAGSTKVPFSFEGALGKYSSSTSKKPRQLMQLDQKLSDLDDISIGSSTEELNYSVFRMIEQVFKSALEIEGANLIESESDYDRIIAGQVRSDSMDLLLDSLLLGIRGKDEGNKVQRQANAYKFVQFLSIKKGMKAISRSFHFLDAQFQAAFVSKLIDYMEHISVFADFNDSKSSQIQNQFSTYVLTPLVQFISKAAWPNITLTVQKILSKQKNTKLSLLRLLSNQAGLVLLCIFLSRSEILKNSMDPVGDNLVLSAWSHLIEEQLFDHLQDQFNDLFKEEPFDENSQDIEFDYGKDHYVWQFLALLAMNIDTRRKQDLVVELRDRIMKTVQEGDNNNVSDLNIFLNALGLDISQLRDAMSSTS